MDPGDAAQHGQRRRVFVEEIGRKSSILTQRTRSGLHVPLGNVNCSLRAHGSRRISGGFGDQSPVGGIEACPVELAVSQS
jgi:hypothetical protein